MVLPSYNLHVWRNNGQARATETQLMLRNQANMAIFIIGIVWNKKQKSFSPLNEIEIAQSCMSPAFNIDIPTPSIKIKAK